MDRNLEQLWERLERETHKINTRPGCTTRKKVLCEDGVWKLEYQVRDDTDIFFALRTVLEPGAGHEVVVGDTITKISRLCKAGFILSTTQ